MMILILNFESIDLDEDSLLSLSFCYVIKLDLLLCDVVNVDLTHF